MDSKHPTEQPRGDAGKRQDSNWFATFSFLDVGGAISASQMRRLVATVSKLWRLTLGRRSDRSRPRAVIL